MDLLQDGKYSDDIKVPDRVEETAIAQTIRGSLQLEHSG